MVFDAFQAHQPFLCVAWTLLIGGNPGCIGVTLLGSGLQRNATNSSYLLLACCSLSNVGGDCFHHAGRHQLEHMVLQLGQRCSHVIVGIARLLFGAADAVCEG